MELFIMKGIEEARWRLPKIKVIILPLMPIKIWILPGRKMERLMSRLIWRVNIILGLELTNNSTLLSKIMVKEERV